MQHSFRYFLHHFRSVFNAADIEIGYGKHSNAAIKIIQADSGFFEQTNPFPENVWWQEWKGVTIPFFFGKPVSELIKKEADGNITIQADIVASAFYLLSGWQEYYCATRDQFGRFPYKESMQCKHGFITLPVVNYYFDILLEAIKSHSGKEPGRQLWPESTFATCLTHDIDRCESGWKIAGLNAIKKGEIHKALGLILKKISGKDSWFNIIKIARLEEKHLARGTYFFLPETAKVNGHPNADHDVTKPKYRQVMAKLRACGHEVAVHGSFGSSTNQKQLQAEIEKLPGQITGNRFHYLQFDPEKSAEVLEKTGLQWDTTLGFAEHFGFRNSYCLPFWPWDFKNQRMHTFVELPLNLMDTTLRHPNYMVLEPNQVIPAIKPMLEEIIKFNGCFTLLWHNENFTGYHIPKDRRIFKDLVKLAQARGTCFLTCSQAAAAISDSTSH